MAQFLILLSAKLTPTKVVDFYDTYLRYHFSEMTKYIVNENLFDEIASSLYDCLHDDNLIIALLKNDMKK